MAKSSVEIEIPYSPPELCYRDSKNALQDQGPKYRHRSLDTIVSIACLRVYLDPRNIS